MMKKHFMFLFMIIFCLSGHNVAGQTTEDFPPASLPSLVSAIKIDGPVNFCGERVPLGSDEVQERLEKELLLILWNRPQVILWLKRAKRYFPYIEKILAGNNMPEDLKYIAVVESALLSHAGSSKGAVGYWQFIKSTGRNYGLVIDRNIDERRNFFASTDAAVSYLKELYELFGSWTLSAAAYNLGEARLQDEKTSQKVDSFYDFYLPLETQRHIFKIVAVKLILSNPARYGFHLQPDDCYQPVSFDRVKLNMPSRTPLYLVAQAAGTHFKQIKELNPEIRGYDLLKGSHIIAVPKGSGENFHSRFASLAEKWRQENKMHIYIVKKGDNLSTIAERFDVVLSSLIAWNDLNQNSYIHPGKKLVIYQ
jgi:membrane-bound lytic murein transglycosylase D